MKSEYQNLSPFEKQIFIGKLVHCVQVDDRCFNLASILIEAAETSGVLDRVQFFPQQKQQENG